MGLTESTVSLLASWGAGVLLPAVVTAVIAYLCGCFNGAVIVSKYILRDDVRGHGSGNAGLTNFYRTFGGPLTFVVILTDVLKAVVALLVAAAALFLAAEKGSPAKDKRNYFLVFLLLLFSYMINGWLGYLCSALAWPALLLVEYQHGKPIQRQLQLVGISEALHLLFLLLTVYGDVSAMSFWTNILWVLLACARGWAALALYKGQEETV